ncbi:MAG: hypothetical protein JST00_07295 [Deltaproteobacteria bacterium]|nr:hypothetical protein [Deltaproteobacteria bacterium]
MVAIALAAAGCGGPMALDPAFAPRATEVPATAPRPGYGTATYGDVSVELVRFSRDDAADRTMLGGAVKVGHDAGRWHLALTAKTPGRDAIPVECAGERAKGNRDPIACAFGPGGSGGTMALTDRGRHGGTLRLLGEDATLRPASTLLGVGYGGAYVERAGAIEAAIDTRRLAEPHVWVAREMAAERRAMVLVALGALHFIVSRNDCQPDPE